MKNIQSGYEKFVSILLFVASQVLGMSPYQVEQSTRNVWGGLIRMELKNKSSIINSIRTTYCSHLEPNEKAHRQCTFESFASCICECR